VEELSDMRKQILSNGELIIEKEEEIKTLKRINKEEIKNKDSILKSKEEVIKKNQEEILSKEDALKSKEEVMVKNQEEINRLKKMLAEEIQAKQELLKSKEDV
jgi:hypothetical protein